jgi:hypothetical protein
MIIIFNKKNRFEIQIDESIPQVIFTPMDYDDIPFVKIELRGLNFHHHSMTCKDCKAFMDSFGTNTLDWFINYSDKTKRLDLSFFGKEYFDNNSIFKISQIENISILKLNLSLLPDNKEATEQQLEQEIKLENYERCCVLRDILSE